ncbi:hypothetical protein IPG36_06230 [bacterium]|nr:MAG: hypothetical protein IPG36_06230 [bacterium]
MSTDSSAIDGRFAVVPSPDGVLFTVSIDPEIVDRATLKTDLESRPWVTSASNVKGEKIKVVVNPASHGSPESWLKQVLAGYVVRHYAAQLDQAPEAPSEDVTIEEATQDTAPDHEGERFFVSKSFGRGYRYIYLSVPLTVAAWESIEQAMLKSKYVSIFRYEYMVSSDDDILRYTEIMLKCTAPAQDIMDEVLALMCQAFGRENYYFGGYVQSRSDAPMTERTARDLHLLAGVAEHFSGAKHVEFVMPDGTRIEISQ